jgi:hypothetical protein
VRCSPIEQGPKFFRYATQEKTKLPGECVRARGAPMRGGASPAAFHAVADDGTRKIAACSFMELMMM